MHRNGIFEFQISCFTCCALININFAFSLEEKIESIFLIYIYIFKLVSSCRGKFDLITG